MTEYGKTILIQTNSWLLTSVPLSSQALHWNSKFHHTVSPWWFECSFHKDADYFEAVGGYTVLEQVRVWLSTPLQIITFLVQTLVHVWRKWLERNFFPSLLVFWLHCVLKLRGWGPVLVVLDKDSRRNMLGPADFIAKKPHKSVWIWLEFKYREINTHSLCQCHYNSTIFYPERPTGYHIKQPFCPLAFPLLSVCVPFPPPHWLCLQGAFSGPCVAGLEMDAWPLGAAGTEQHWSCQTGWGGCIRSSSPSSGVNCRTGTFTQPLTFVVTSEVMIKVRGQQGPLWSGISQAPLIASFSFILYSFTEFFSLAPSLSSFCLSIAHILLQWPVPIETSHLLRVQEGKQEKKSIGKMSEDLGVPSESEGFYLSCVDPHKTEGWVGVNRTEKCTKL